MVSIIAALLPVLVQLLQEAPQLNDDVKKVWDLLTSTNAQTPEQQAAIDAALEAAHTALQNS